MKNEPTKRRQLPNDADSLTALTSKRRKLPNSADFQTALNSGSGKRRGPARPAPNHRSAASRQASSRSQPACYAAASTLRGDTVRTKVRGEVTDGLFRLPARNVEGFRPIFRR